MILSRPIFILYIFFVYSLILITKEKNGTSGAMKEMTVDEGRGTQNKGLTTRGLNCSCVLLDQRSEEKRE